MQHVFVVDATRRPLMPCRPARARRLLSQHQAAVLRRFPFTIILATAKPEAVVEPREIDHIVPRSRGGSDRPANLALSCHICNQAKGDQTAAEFGHPEVQTQAKAPLKDVAAVNSTRRALHQRLVACRLPVETASGGRTKWNRVQRRLPKTQWLDALCVGASTPERIQGWHDVVPLSIKAQRWQRRQMCPMDRHGFPRTRAKGSSRVAGFKTGDQVRAFVPVGAKAGTYVGKVSVRARGSFNITIRTGVVTDIPARYCQLLQRADGYVYQKGARAFQPIS